jgi:hypothetical protein
MWWSHSKADLHGYTTPGPWYARSARVSLRDIYAVSPSRKLANINALQKRYDAFGAVRMARRMEK